MSKKRINTAYFIFSHPYIYVKCSESQAARIFRHNAQAVSHTTTNGKYNFTYIVKENQLEFAKRKPNICHSYQKLVQGIFV